MQSIEHELQIRKDEVENMFQTLRLLERGAVTLPSDTLNTLTVRTSMRAGIILMLYNAVESTVTNCIKRIHAELINQQVKFSNCNPSIQKTLIVYYENVLQKSSDNNRSCHILEMIKMIMEQAGVSISYDDLDKYYSLYSGNLDSKEIISVMGKYGLEFSYRISELKTIKDNRNKLAHGENSFEEVGRDISLQQLEVMKEKTFKYLHEIIESMKDYLRNSKYLCTT